MKKIMNKKKLDKKLKELTTIINPEELEESKEMMEEHFFDFMAKFAFFNILSLMFGVLDEKRMKEEYKRVINLFGDEARSSFSKRFTDNFQYFGDSEETKEIFEQRRQTTEKALKEFLEDKKEEMFEFVEGYIQKRDKAGGKR